MNYSKIISNIVGEKSKEDVVSENEKVDKYELNPTPKIYKKESSYGVWEHAYFKHILDLYDIFCRNMTTLDISINTHSVEFLDNFCRFVRQNSSGEISLYLENLPEYVEKLYEQFTIKRNESI